MNKKLLLACAGVLAFGTYASFAQTAPAPTTAPAVTVTATASVASQYMFRGQRLNGAGFQPQVEMGAGDLTLGAWANFPLKDKVPDSSDPEIDLYGSYNFTIEKDVSSVTPGFTSYHYPSAPTSAGFYKWTFEPNIAFNYQIKDGPKITPKFYYDLVLKAATYELTGTYAVPMKDIGSELDFTATAGTYKGTDVANDTTPAVKAWGDYWLVGVALPFQVTKEAKLTIGFAYTEGRNAFTKQGNFGRVPNALAVGRGVATISYAWSF